MPTATKGRTKKAPGLLENPEYIDLKNKVATLEKIVEHLIYEYPGQKGEKLRSWFYGRQPL